MTIATRAESGGPITATITTPEGPRPVRAAYLPDAVHQWARESGAAPAVTFLDHGPRPGAAEPVTETTLSYAELDERARAVAVRLRRDCPAGARVAILCPHESGYVVAFLACLYAGVVAVPLYAPELLRGHERLRAVLDDCDPECCLTTAGAARSVRAGLERIGRPAVNLVCVDDAAETGAADAAQWRRPDLAPDAVAYLQYTSGSTGAPSGVRVTHQNIALTAYQLRTHFPGAAVMASWVPFFHDMGLVFGIVNPLSAGAHSVHISPMAFVQDPVRWLRAISDHRADWSVTPNFALSQCVRRVTEEQKRTLDLSCLKSLNIASEPVHARSVRAFAEAFAECGLADTALAPSYGLAEVTLAVSAPPVGSGTTVYDFDRAGLEVGEVRLSATAEGAVRLVGCGVPKAGVSIRIADPDTGRGLPGGRVGEIWLRGPNVADGYWRQPRRSAEVFPDLMVEVDGSRSEGPWLRTGDLGFVYQGQVYIAGRAKDLIIVRGRNHYPEDIEATVEDAIPDAASVTAFSVEVEGVERLVVVLEAEPRLLTSGPNEHEAVIQAVRRAVNRDHGLVPYETAVVRRGHLPRTTSGKIKRGACREQYLGERAAR